MPAYMQDIHRGVPAPIAQAKQRVQVFSKSFAQAFAEQVTKRHRSFACGSAPPVASEETITALTTYSSYDDPTTAPTSEELHTYLDLLGMVPGFGEVFDLINGAWYALEGDWENSSLSVGSALPLAGNFIGAGKLAVKGGGAIIDASKALGKADNAVDAGKDATRYAGRTRKLTTPEATTMAKELGYQKINEKIDGRPIYYNPKGKPKYISPDTDVHSGGTWKGADNVKNLRDKTKREGTYNEELSRIGK